MENSLLVVSIFQDSLFKKIFIIIIFIPKKRNKQKIVEEKPGGNRQQIILRLILGYFIIPRAVLGIKIWYAFEF